MSVQLVEKAFGRMGARIKFEPAGRWQRQDFSIDIQRDRDGEFFEVRQKAGLPPEVIQVSPEQRHLVLMVREGRDGRDKNKFLCGHDERHWFVAAVPEHATGNNIGIRNVETAMAALRPEEAKADRGTIRQGEWFFTPVSNLDESSGIIVRNEPLSRGAGSKPHLCQEILRRGGTPVMVHRHISPDGMTIPEYEKYIKQHPEASATNFWTRMVRNAEVFARGWVRHSDHRTIHLDGWHQVHMSRERFATHGRAVAFGSGVLAWR
jgi:hypothetical protein